MHFFFFFFFFSACFMGIMVQFLDSVAASIVVDLGFVVSEFNL